MTKHLRPGRPSPRLRGYDYAQPGGYFITICTQDRLCLFGQVVDGEMHLNAAGRMLREVWEELPSRYPHITLDAFMVLPNHIHGILLIQEERPRQGLGQIVGAFKSLTTNRYMEGVRTLGWQPFPGTLWQDNYFEHIIRSEAAMERIRAYILDNARRWESDPERPREQDQ